MTATRTRSRSTRGRSTARTTQRPPAQRRPRLRRSDCSEPGLRRLRRGRGFAYVDEDGRRLDDPEVLERVRELMIPPAWTDVWICPDPLRHLQATGIDAAGRKQYLYHPRWRERRDQEKFRRMERFAAALPRLRERVAADLAETEPTRKAVLAGAVRLLDVGLFRVGSEEYAEEDHGVGLATVRRDHVSVAGDAIVFDYPGKGGTQRLHRIEDPLAHDLVQTLRRRRGGPAELLAYRDRRRWHRLRASEINEYLKDKIGDEFSAKDFRTWNATVLAAVSLAATDVAAERRAQTKTARKRAINAAVRAVAELLGNTPAVARRAYIDPRVFDRYQSGWTIAGAFDDIERLEPGDDAGRAQLEAAVLDLLEENRSSPALERV